LSVIIFETFYHAINTQDEYIQLSKLIYLLTWAPSCLVYSNCHNSALNSSSSSISEQTPLGALSYGSAWTVRIKNNWTKIKWNYVKKGYIQCWLKTAGIILAESGVVQSLTEWLQGWLFHYLWGVSKVSPQQRTRVQMSPEAQNGI
jgi:hypothetical protein